MQGEFSADGLTYSQAAALLGLTRDGVVKRVKSGRLRGAGDRRVDRAHVEAERAALLARLQATDGRAVATPRGQEELVRRLRAQVAALDEEVTTSYRLAQQAWRERDEAIRKQDGYLVALMALADTERHLADRRHSRDP